MFKMSRLRLSSVLILCILYVHLPSIYASEDDIPLTKLGSNSGPTLKFLYCYSCGYKKVFEEYVGILREKYPEIKVDGDHYNPPGYNMLISKILGATKITVIIFILSRYNIFQRIGQTPPAWWQWCIENRLYACLMIFFLCNLIEGHLVSSGAFEILLNDVPVWSKLETGRIPQPLELFQIIDNHMRMSMSEIDVRSMNFNK